MQPRWTVHVWVKQWLKNKVICHTVTTHNSRTPYGISIWHNAWSWARIRRPQDRNTPHHDRLPLKMGEIRIRPVLHNVGPLYQTVLQGLEACLLHICCVLMGIKKQMKKAWPDGRANKRAQRSCPTGHFGTCVRGCPGFCAHMSSKQSDRRNTRTPDASGSAARMCVDQWHCSEMCIIISLSCRQCATCLIQDTTFWGMGILNKHPVAPLNIVSETQNTLLKF